MKCIWAFPSPLTLPSIVTYLLPPSCKSKAIIAFIIVVAVSIIMIIIVINTVIISLFSTTGFSPDVILCC